MPLRFGCNQKNRGFITVDYEFKNGFDVVFVLYDEVERPDSGYIETVDLHLITAEQYYFTVIPQTGM